MSGTIFAMRQSTLFSKTRKSAPKGEVAKNAQLLIRAGYIHKEMAGVYSYLPLGFRVLDNIVRVIRQEMNAVGGQEMVMSALQDKALWERTDRWDAEKVDVWFKTALAQGGELGLGFTHEEPLTNIMRDHISSWRDLPVYAYQFQTKFRNEIRARSGIMRTREFLMKDLYSFSKDAKEHRAFYDKTIEAYKKIFDRVGIGEQTYLTFASGGSFSRYSHEFQTLCETGEDTIYVDEEKKIAVNKEVYDDPQVYAESGIEKGRLVERRAVEVGNIFTLGTRFSEALGLSYKDKSSAATPVFMGSYGIGPARVMGTIVELLSDEKGIVWPAEVAPFSAHIVSISNGNADVVAEADRLHELLGEHGVEALYDDRDLRAGEKFADADLIGIPTRLIVSEKTISEGGVEVVSRKNGATKLVPESEIIEYLRKSV